jgi:hypothetical protein
MKEGETPAAEAPKQVQAAKAETVEGQAKEKTQA